MADDQKPSSSRLSRWWKSIKDNPTLALVKAFILCGGFILLISVVILLSDVGTEVYESLGQKPPFRWERWAIILIIPAFICFLIATIIYATKERNQANWRFVGYQLMAFIILALSLRAFGLHHGIEFLFGEEEGQQAVASQQQTTGTDSTEAIEAQKAQELQKKNNAEEAARAISEMAAIIILFVLAELAAFVAHDVTEAKSMLENLSGSANEAANRTEYAVGEIGGNLKSLKDTTDRIKQLRLLGTIATLHTDVQEEAVDLVSAWGIRVPAPKQSNGSTTDTNQAHSVTTLCWRVLLKEYLKEELLDIAPGMIAPEMIDQGIPPSVTPRIGTDKQDVSFIATNVGFYAKFLSSLVEVLSNLPAEARNSDEKLCMAIITNMLPAHCWNWPMPDGGWRSYKPIDAYRKSMLDAVGESGVSAQIDRVLLVYDDSKKTEENKDDTEQEKGEFDLFCPVGGVFWRHELLQQMWEKWYILLFEDSKHESVKSSLDFAVKSGNLGKNALPLFPKPVKEAATKGLGSIYPMIIDGTSGVNFTDNVEKQWNGKKLSEEYNKLHGEHGICWELPLDEKSLDLFEGRHDIMFIGLGKGSDQEAGLWANEIDCDWGICLMSSMNVITETMFLTVISGRGVKIHYDWCKDLLDHNLIWTKNRLNKKPATVQPKP